MIEINGITAIIPHIIMINLERVAKIISIKGLKGYVIFITLLFIGYFYLQLNGIFIYNSTSSEHEGGDHSYSSSHHK